ncbi:MAG: GNAT family N-acetyltransferase [Anaerolineales bacterium]|jgi:ribosomal protein S18 acetylase RimI-like enzyme
MQMVNLPPEFTVRPPNNDDVQTVYDLIVACDIAEYGEPDSSIGDLMDEWSSMRLERDAWLLYDQGDELVGYAAVFDEGDYFVFDFFTHPDYEGSELAKYLLGLCEAHTREQLSTEGVETPGKLRVITPNVNKVEQNILQEAGFQIHKFYFRMQIELGEAPVEQTWPKDYHIRTINPGEEDRMVYEFVKTAFQRPGRVFPPLDGWKGYMMRPDHFNPDLWFLLFIGSELTAVALCYDYPEYGWLRQLGVDASLRRRGIGSALLQHTFHVFYKRGHKTVALGVDSERPDAYRLYENVGMQCVRQYNEYEKMIEVNDNG